MKNNLWKVSVTTLLLIWPKVAYADLDFLIGQAVDLIFILLVAIYLLLFVYRRLPKHTSEITKKVVIVAVVLLICLLTINMRREWLQYTEAAIFTIVILTIPAVLIAKLLSVFIIGAVESKDANRRAKNLTLFFLLILLILFLTYINGRI